MNSLSTVLNHEKDFYMIHLIAILTGLFKAISTPNCKMKNLNFAVTADVQLKQGFVFDESSEIYVSLLVSNPASTSSFLFIR
jgi:hypothetical protein